MSPSFSGNCHLTRHATLRMQQRGISSSQIETVLCYGRTVQEGRVSCKVVGRKEMSEYAHEGINLSAVEGIHVVIAGDGSVVTAYRCYDLHRIRAARRRPVTWH